MNKTFNIIVFCIIFSLTFCLKVSAKKSTEPLIFGEALAKCKPYSAKLTIEYDNGNQIHEESKNILGKEKGMCIINYITSSQMNKPPANAYDAEICLIPLKNLSKISKEDLNNFDNIADKYCKWKGFGEDIFQD